MIRKVQKLDCIVQQIQQYIIWFSKQRNITALNVYVNIEISFCVPTITCILLYVSANALISYISKDIKNIIRFCEHKNNIEWFYKC